MIKDTRVSCCTQSCSRLWQFEQTFFENLDAIHSLGCEWCILDYDSLDGTHEFLMRHASDAIRSGVIQYARVNGAERYDMIRAKNIVSLLSSGEILFNLDVDNFIDTQCLRDVRDAFADPNVRVVHNWSGEYNDGTHGRVAIRRSAFLESNGYAEDLLGVSVHDDDIVRRHRTQGIVVELQSVMKPAIANSKDATTEHLPEALREQGYEAIQLRNRKQALDSTRVVPSIKPMLVQLCTAQTYPNFHDLLVSVEYGITGSSY